MSIPSIIGATEKRREGSNGRRSVRGSVVGNMAAMSRSGEEDAHSNSSHARLKRVMVKTRALCRAELIR